MTDRGTRVLLLHGVTGSALMWRRVLPLLPAEWDVVAMTALGHRGGRDITRRPVRLIDIADDAELTMDELGWDTAHLVGNSMGGYVAAELARRGRAASLCLFSPAGCWDPEDPAHRAGRDRLRRVIRDTRRARPLLPLLLRLASARRFALRDNACHGDRVTAAELIDNADDLLGCEAKENLLATDETLPVMDALSCPVLLAWPTSDRILPFDTDGARARALFPTAEFLRLDDVGHVPMFDDPALVASLIVQAVGMAAASDPAQPELEFKPNGD